MNASLQIIASKAIDPNKWDACLAADPEAPVYATRNFLDSFCDHWSALIIGDYEAVMPIPWRKKFGIRYSYAPPFIQQLGLIGTVQNIPTAEILQALQSFIRYGDLFWNHTNQWIQTALAVRVRNNFILSLRSSYHEIESRYSKELLYNLKKSGKAGLHYGAEFQLQAAVEMYQKQYGARFPHIQDRDYKRLKVLAEQVYQRQGCLIRSVQQQDEILAIALMFAHGNRMYLLLNATNQKGRTLAANHFLIDHLIQEFSEENLLLDFEGSDLEGVQHFYESFHPVNQPYFHSRLNNLPAIVQWGIKVLKKTINHLIPS